LVLHFYFGIGTDADQTVRDYAALVEVVKAGCIRALVEENL